MGHHNVRPLQDLSLTAVAMVENQNKGGGKTSPPVPQELRGKWHRTAGGDPICFRSNCRSGCPEKGIKPGQKCSKGLHICAAPRCGGEHSLQQHGAK